ncbi:type III-D CRISPR-associated protein Csx19 [Actinokineospora sp.]|uniref:type III-D CRISPR-associated protein Csx19 n=1 Tax=Actinokineospora sp. TaxID=1872133 RepID=UPI004037B13D
MTTLYWASAESITVTDAVDAAGFPDPPTGLVSTTAWHGFVRAHGGLLDRGGPPLDPTTVFDARFFAEGPIELRWVHESAGLGRAVLLAQDDVVVSRAGTPFGAADSHPVHATFEQTLMLWGTPDGAPSDGWQSLREHRIGTLRVPGLPAAPAAVARAGLLLREYVAQDDYGNAYVLDELLHGIRWQDTTTWERSDSEASTGQEAAA